MGQKRLFRSEGGRQASVLREYPRRTDVLRSEVLRATHGGLTSLTVEIEDLFHYDLTHLPLDGIGNRIRREFEDITSVDPS